MKQPLEVLRLYPDHDYTLNGAFDARLGRRAGSRVPGAPGPDLELDGIPASGAGLRVAQRWSGRAGREESLSIRFLREPHGAAYASADCPLGYNDAAFPRVPRTACHLVDHGNPESGIRRRAHAAI